MGTVNTENFEKEKYEESNERFLKKRMHGQFGTEIAEILDVEKSWYWLYRGDFKVDTGSIMRFQRTGT